MGSPGIFRFSLAFLYNFSFKKFIRNLHANYRMLVKKTTKNTENGTKQKICKRRSNARS